MCTMATHRLVVRSDLVVYIQWKLSNLCGHCVRQPPFYYAPLLTL